MEQEKYLLTKVLCEMLPYGIQIAKANVIYPMTGVNIALGYVELAVSERISIEEARPYLRPLSSMTNDERFEYLDFLKVEIQDGGYVTENYVVRLEYMPGLIDWLLKHHFDYRGLIGMGIALPAPEGMYDFK